MSKETPDWVKKITNTICSTTGSKITPEGVLIIIYGYEMMKKREKLLYDQQDWGRRWGSMSDTLEQLEDNTK